MNKGSWIPVPAINETGLRIQKPTYFHNNFRQGNDIIHAATGYSMDGVFGTKDEDYFFRVKWCVANQTPHFGPMDLFFYDPKDAEQYLGRAFSERTHVAFQAKLASKFGKKGINHR
jgi:hypothetical protein